MNNENANQIVAKRFMYIKRLFNINSNVICDILKYQCR